MTLGANRGSETISKWFLQDMNIINSPARCPQAIITQLWLSASIPKITLTAQKHPKAKSFSCENTAAQIAPFIIWGLNQAAVIDNPGAYWNPFHFIK